MLSYHWYDLPNVERRLLLGGVVIKVSQPNDHQTSVAEAADEAAKQ